MSKTIKIIFALLIIALVVQHELIMSGLYNIPEEYIESALTVFILLIAYFTYRLYKKELQEKEIEKKKLEDNLKSTDEKLLESFKYIGLVNVRLPLVKNITTDLLKNHSPREKNKKEIINQLLSMATTSIAKVEWGIFRFIDTQSKTTVKEFVYNPSGNSSLNKHIPNSELLLTHEKNLNFNTLENFSIIHTSDQETQIQCFFIFPKNQSTPTEELPLLLAITDQAQLFFKYLYSPEVPIR
jgi:hypothetical protein